MAVAAGQRIEQFLNPNVYGGLTVGAGEAIAERPQAPLDARKDGQIVAQAAILGWVDQLEEGSEIAPTPVGASRFTAAAPGDIILFGKTQLTVPVAVTDLGMSEFAAEPLPRLPDLSQGLESSLAVLKGRGASVKSGLFVGAYAKTGKKHEELFSIPVSAINRRGKSVSLDAPVRPEPTPLVVGEAERYRLQHAPHTEVIRLINTLGVIGHVENETESRQKRGLRSIFSR